MIKVRFILAWQTYRVGDVIEPTAMDRDWLLRAGYVEVVGAADAKPAPKKKSGAQPNLARTLFRGGA